MRLNVSVSRANPAIPKKSVFSEAFRGMAHLERLCGASLRPTPATALPSSSAALRAPKIAPGDFVELPSAWFVVIGIVNNYLYLNVIIGAPVANSGQQYRAIQDEFPQTYRAEIKIYGLIYLQGGFRSFFNLLQILSDTAPTELPAPD